jgi:hypothetical protein
MTSEVRIFLALIAAVLVGLPGVAGQSPSAFVPLFDGTLSGWVVEKTAAGNFSVADGVLRVQGPAGWLRSEQRFQDVSLRIEFRFLTPDADSGIFLRASGETEFMRGWPNHCYQVQVRNPVSQSRFPPAGGLFRHGMPDGPTTFDESAARQAAKETGIWQVLEIDLAGERLIARLNGIEVLRAGNVQPSAGHIGVQGETGALEYRSIQIRQ